MTQLNKCLLFVEMQAFPISFSCMGFMLKRKNLLLTGQILSFKSQLLIPTEKGVKYKSSAECGNIRLLGFQV